MTDHTEWVAPWDNWKAIWEKQRAYRETHPDSDVWDPEATVGRMSVEASLARRAAVNAQWEKDMRTWREWGRP